MKRSSKEYNVERRLFSPSDMFPIIILIALPIAYFLAAPRNNGTYAEISCNGELIASVSLDKNGVYSYPMTGDMEFTVSDGGICVSKSNCPDKVCMDVGMLSQAGDTAVCVPNRVVVTVYGQMDGDIDGVVR